MTHSAPIACSLSAAEYRQRIQDADDVARDALRARRPIEGGARLTFTRDAAVRERLEAFVAAESKCCSFLTLDLAEDGTDLVLTVTGPAEAAPLIADFFARA